MNRQQQFLLTMLGEIKDICDRNGITYFIGFGTLIGAVRNEGFLPWDDDIDVIMTYDNWIRFQEACKTQLPPNRYLGASTADPEYGHLLPRYISTDTTAIHTAQSLSEVPSGELIDIFILDPMPDDRAEYEAYRQDLYLYTTFVNYANTAAYRVNLDAELYRQCLEREKTEGTMAVRRDLASRLASHHSEEGENYAFRWQGAPVLFKRWWFEKPVPMKFENLTVNAPQGMSAYLSFYYGEEWVEVPTDINPAKHNTAASMDFAYADALEYFHPKYDRKQLLHEMEERRYLVLKLAPEKNRLADDRAQARAVVAAHEAKRKVAENREAFDRGLAARDGRILEPLLREYLAVQTSRELMGGRNADKAHYRYLHPVFVDVPDEVFEGGLYVLMATGHIRQAHILLDQRAERGIPDSPRMARVREAILAFNAACDDYQFGRYGDGLEKALRLREFMPAVDAFLKLEVALRWRLYESTPTDEGLEAFERAVEQGRAEYPADGFFLKYHGDAEYARGDDEAGRADYLTAAETTRNGLVLLDIFKKTGYHPGWLRSPAWAHTAGVAQWEGPEPEIPETMRPPAAQAKPDSCQEFLLGLLSELGGICDSLEIPYILGPSTAQALCAQHRLPESAEAWQLVVRPEDALKLKRHVLGDGALPNRKLQYPGNSGVMLNAELRYHATDTLFMDLKKDDPDGFNSLYVRVLVIEPETYAGRLQDELAQRSERAARPLHSRKAKLLARLRAVTHRRNADDALFERAMKAGCGGSPVLQVSGERVSFDLSFLQDRQMARFDGGEFPIPSELGAYLQLTVPASASADSAPGSSVVRSAELSYDELVAEGGLDSSYFARREAMRHNADAARERQIIKRFRFNFRQIKLAVATKRLALALLPRKQELLELGKKGDWQALRAAMADYLKVSRKYKSCGICNFDDDLFRLMKEVRAHAR